jgi:hypothetical protein
MVEIVDIAHITPGSEMLEITIATTQTTVTLAADKIMACGLIAVEARDRMEWSKQSIGHFDHTKIQIAGSGRCVTIETSPQLCLSFSLVLVAGLVGTLLLAGVRATQIEQLPRTGF